MLSTACQVIKDRLLLALKLIYFIQLKGTGELGQTKAAWKLVPFPLTMTV